MDLSKACFGSMCMFVPLSNRRGIKLYTTKKERDFASREQRRAHKLGLAPKVIKNVKLKKTIEVLNDCTGCFQDFTYGYITQKARVDEIIGPIIFERLWQKMNKYGFNTEDLCEPNVGFIGHKLVCIDFDCYTAGVEL